MKKLLLLILLLPFFSFSQFDWKKGWNGNIELGTPLYNVGAHIKYGRFFSRGYVGGKVFNSSVLDGKLSLRFGANMMHQQGNFFIHQEKHNQDNHITLGLQYSFLNNKYCSLTFGLGYMRYKSVSFLSPSHYNYMNIDGAEMSLGLLFLPKSRISLGIDLGIGFGQSIEYYRHYYHKGTLFTGTKPFIFTLQYKLFQKEKVFFINK